MIVTNSRVVNSCRSPAVYSKMAKILLVEDDVKLSDIIQDMLDMHQYQTDVSSNGKDALSLLQHYQYDLVVLDWNLPEMTGVEILRAFRAKGGTTPVLMLTANNEFTHKEMGLDSGADDYLTKPFHDRELLARIRALLRRPHAYKGEILRVRDITLDSSSRTVTKGDVQIFLQPLEFALLHFMMKNPNQTMTKETLFARVWSNESDATDIAIRKCVERLRKKLDSPGQPTIIETVHGIGYVLKS